MLLFAATACYQPDLSGEGYFRCDDPAQSCPSGFECNSETHICERTGTTPSADAGATTDGAGVTGSCQLVQSEPTDLANDVDVLGSFGAVLDGTHLVVSFPGAPTANTETHTLFVTRAAVTDAASTTTWAPQGVCALPAFTAMGAVPYFTAIDAVDGTVAVVFGTPAADANDERLGLYLEPADNTSEPTTVFLSPLSFIQPFTGAYPAIRLLGPDRAVLAGQSAGPASGSGSGPLRARIAWIDTNGTAASAKDVELTGAGSAVVGESGLFNRLSLSSGTGTGTATLAFVATGNASGGLGGGLAYDTTQVYVAQAEINAQRSVPVSSWGSATVVASGAAFDIGLQGLASAQGPGGYELVFPWKPTVPADSAVSLVSAVQGSGDLVPIEPGGTGTVAGGRPALAVLGGHAAVAYETDGRVWVTARLNSDSPWLTALALDDTTAANPAAGQVSVLATSFTDDTLTLQLFYVRQRQDATHVGLYHRTAVCSFH